VQFHWDQEGKKDEKTSCWIRVAQGWAGKAWGQWFLPRIGQEVVVSFLEGDPDQPLVTGSVYNAVQTVPYALPGEMTKSTIKSNSTKGGGGFNEFRYEDKKGSEEIYLHAQKDWNSVVENLRTAKINESNDTIDVMKGNRAITVHKGHNTVDITEGNRTVTLGKGNLTTDVQTGTETHKVKGTRTLTITGNETHNSKANHTLNVTGDYAVNVDGKLTISVVGNVVIESKTGNVTVESKAGNLDLKAAMNWNAKGLQVAAKADTTAKLEGAMVTVKGSATGEVDGGGMLTLKGGLVKIN